jgi:hypothetical protein
MLVRHNAPAARETPAMSLPDNHPRLLKRAYSQGELIADGFVHAAAIIAGAIAFSVLFVRIALYGAGQRRAWPWRSTPPASSCCSAFPAPTT